MEIIWKEEKEKPSNRYEYLISYWLLRFRPSSCFDDENEDVVVVARSEMLRYINTPKPIKYSTTNFPFSSVNDFFRAASAHHLAVSLVQLDAVDVLAV